MSFARPLACRQSHKDWNPFSSPTHITQAHQIDEEWRTLPSAPSSVDPTSRREVYPTASENDRLNRYADVLPYEATRVVLEDPALYINANAIRSLPSYQCIATQAPLPSSFNTFWQMVWEKQVRVVVMLARFVEKRKVKAHCYWPCEENAEVFGDITVVLEQTVQLCAGITIHHLVMLRGEDSRKLVHLHYTEWPDFGVPHETTQIRRLASLVDGFLDELGPLPCGAQSQNAFPVLVHCSAGVGRAGTFLAFLKFRELRKSGVPAEEISVHAIVSSLRQERMCMVQTKPQYEFIYRLIDDDVAGLDEDVEESAFPSAGGFVPPPFARSQSAAPFARKSKPVFQRSGGPHKSPARSVCTRSFLRTTQTGSPKVSTVCP